MNNKRNIGLILSYIYYILNAAISLFLSSFVIRKVGSIDYGVYQTVASFSSYLVLLEFGLGTIMARNIALHKKDNKKLIDKEYSSLIFINLFLCILILIISVCFYFLVKPLYFHSLTNNQIVYGKKILIFVSLSLLFSFLTSSFNGVLLGFEHYLFERILLIIKLFVRSLLVVFLLLKIPFSIVITIIDCVISVLILFLTFIYSKRKCNLVFKFSYIDKRMIVAILPFAFGMFLQSIANTMNSNVDKFLIGIFMSPDDVTIYSISLSLYLMFSSIGSLPVSIFLPYVADKMIDKNISRDRNKLTSSFVFPCKLNTIILGFILFGFLVVGRQFVALVYGQLFLKSWIYALILMIPTYFDLFNGVIVNAIDIVNKRLQRSLLLLLVTALNFVLTLIVIKRFGIIGASLVTCITVLIKIVMMNIFYSKCLNINILQLFNKALFKISFIFLVCALITYRVSSFITNDLLSFLIGGFSFVVLAFCTIIFFGLTSEDKYMFKKVLFKSKRSVQK